MKLKREHRETMNEGRPSNNAKSCSGKISFDNLFDAEWDDLVITKDETGKFVARLSCCENHPV